MTERQRSGKRATIRPPVLPTDRRAAQRVPVQLIVRLSATDHFQHVSHGVALDLSERGCKISSTEALPIGSFWDLYLTIPETARPILISEVRIVRSAQLEYGLELLRITARERTRLRHFIWKHMNRSTLSDGPPLFALVDRPGPQRPHLTSLP
ncbi:MAG: PilZ domain-containing protein [Nitrospirota bacterium]|nr:PilZ domain-containing protein [Nitrospirota bacterium]MDP2383132.1 PilZ domain-containing protein [Nitrospirota bacterium]MDP3598256.1 PilZ domain-containing protein [Nitrospirota bacterium]